MIPRASSSVIGQPFTFCIRVTSSVHPFRSLFFPRGRLSGWQMEHLASNSAFVFASAGDPAGAVSTPPRPLGCSPSCFSPTSSAPRRARFVGSAAKMEPAAGRNAATRTAPNHLFLIVFLPCLRPPSLPVRRGEVLKDLVGVRVRDPARLLLLHVQDDRLPPPFLLDAGGGPVEAVADAALLFEEGLPLRHDGDRGGRRRRDGLRLLLFRAPGK